MFAEPATGNGLGFPLVEPIGPDIDSLREKNFVRVLNHEDPTPRPGIRLIASLARALDRFGLDQSSNIRDCIRGCHQIFCRFVGHEEACRENKAPDEGIAVFRVQTRPG
jgi:hypothetical protein